MRKLLLLLLVLVSSSRLTAEELKTPIELGSSDLVFGIQTTEGRKSLVLVDAEFDKEPRTEVLPRNANGKYDVHLFEIVDYKYGPREQFGTGLLGAYLAVGERRVGFPVFARTSFEGSQETLNGTRQYVTRNIPVNNEPVSLKLKAVVKNTKLLSLQLTVPVMKQTEDGKFVFEGEVDTLNLVSAARVETK